MAVYTIYGPATGGVAPRRSVIAAYDAVGPQLRRLVIPVRGRVRDPLLFATAPRDVFSATDQVRWTFGDGSETTGDAVTHAFARPGRYPVTVAAVDRAGNVTRTTRTVSITK